MKLTKNVILGGAVATTIVAGTITFNTDLAEAVKNNIDQLKTKLEAFVENDAKLVEKYEELRSDAKDEISRLEAEVTKANADITELKTLSDEVVKYFENINPKNPDELPGLDDEIVEEEPIAIATATAHFYQDSINVTITLNEDIDIAVGSKGNIKIQYLDNQGKVLKSKSKIYSGYLNCNGDKFGNGFEFTDKYSNQLYAGNTYSTTLSTTAESQSTIDAIDQVIITVTNDRNESETITINK